MAMVPIPWARRRWALPFLTILAPPSAGATSTIGGTRRSSTGRSWPRFRARSGWNACGGASGYLADQALAAGSPSGRCGAGFAAIELIAALRRHACLITRLRIDASLFAPAPPRRAGQMGRSRVKGRRLPTFKAVLADPKPVWSPITVTEW